MRSIISLIALTLFLFSLAPSQTKKGEGFEFLAFGKNDPFQKKRDSGISHTAYSHGKKSLSDSVQEAWVRKFGTSGFSYNEVRDMALDDEGNIYVTGVSYISSSDRDYATVKYNAAGVEQWVAYYSGPENHYDYANALVLDKAGNVYVTGMSDDDDGYDDYATVKYNSAGVEQWVARYDGPESQFPAGYAKALAVDAAGNVYVTGQSWDVDTGFDYTTVKYNASGVEQWVSRYNGTGNSEEIPTALTVDAVGNVYITGFSEDSNGVDYVTLKYNSAGIEQWAARYDGYASLDDHANDLAVDAGGNVYVTGKSQESVIYSDYATIKYNSDGDEEWAVRYGPGSSSHDQANALALDEAGNVYVTGTATVKYNSSGVEQWAVRYKGEGNYFDQAFALALDGTGGVYVSGEGWGSGTGTDIVTIKYNSAGIEQWEARYNGSGNSQDTGLAIAVDGSENAYVAGVSGGVGWSIYTTVKYQQIPTGVEEIPLGVPNSYRLLQNYPNPFNPATTINYQLPKSAQVELTIFNLLGQKVTTLVSALQTAGEKSVVWDGTNAAGEQVGSGIYFYHLQAGEFIETRKMLLAR